ncbi:MAG: PaaI family thioesterase [Crocinitomicaceae bacterium]|jgi:uncharacterized protein (TIGR00369 family)|nr:PaaI family thioesterase [Crocinitomicaceae bacterium]MBT5403291.1 PaaI family thioesterase [Crocinitomicaceae bacterium]MBT6030325.1 PaaI family thioesterase [Crocinitomicaceae bacterium]MBT6513230.1 PaaI family thioesterase [Crocinitomicaceae bacterium]MDG2331994.1 PaaI family thioesterase [Flavobacteriales bacterium]
MNAEHFRKLERMYLGANFNKALYETSSITISEGRCSVGLEVNETYFHALGAMHGSVYFKMLDDAAFFAVSSVVDDYFVLTTSFNINLIRPVSEGKVRAFGEIRFSSENLFTASATLFNDVGKEVAFGTGNFVKSKVPLSQKIGYK